MHRSDRGSPRSGDAAADTQLVVTTQKLHDLLKQREFHLAELIDEVVYAEERNNEAVRGNATVQEGVNRLEGAFQQLLRFHLILTEEVILPALLDALKLRTKADHSIGASVLCSATRKALHSLAASPALARATRQLVEEVLERDAQTAADNVLPTTSTSTSGGQQSMEQAVVLSGMLWRKQRDLLADLDEVKLGLSTALAVADVDTNEDARPPYKSPSPAQRGSSADALMTINRPPPRRRSAPAGGVVVELQERLAATQQERDALREQLQTRERDDTLVASLLADKRQLESEVLFAQRRTLEEQARNRDFKQHMEELEAIVEKTQHAARQGLVTTEEELRRLSRGGDVARAALESEIARLRIENAALVESSERLMRNTSSGEVRASRKVAKLEGVVAALKADLNVMESRLAVIQDQREAERQRILHQFEQEKQRLRRERDECQQLIDKMAEELQLLSRDHDAMRAAASVQRM